MIEKLGFNICKPSILPALRFLLCIEAQVGHVIAFRNSELFWLMLAPSLHRESADSLEMMHRKAISPDIFI